MAPPETLARRWRKLKKRCSFSSSDRLVRSKSFTEQDAIKGEDGEKYLTVGSRDVNRFHGIREKIQQWNTELKKRRSTENLHQPPLSITETERREEESMFVLASPHQGYVKSAVVVSSAIKTMERRNSPRNSTPIKSRKEAECPAWSSPSPSPPASENSSDFSQENQRNCHSYTSNSQLYQDQDSGYDGFCPEKSIYSTGSSDTSSLLSSEGLEHSPATSTSLDLYSKQRTRPRPAPIYEKHRDYGDMRNSHHRDYVEPVNPSFPHYGTVSPRAKIAQATVINLVKTRSISPESTPPPLPPRPSLQQDYPTSLPPLPIPKPRGRNIQHGAVSLPRKRVEERGRRRGSYHDPNKDEKKEPELVVEPVSQKVGMSVHDFACELFSKKERFQ